MNLEAQGHDSGAASGALAEPRRGGTLKPGLIPILMIILLSTVVAAGVLFSHQWTLAQAAKTASGEGFYWSVTQYQLAHQRLKQELRAIAAGEPVQAQTLARRWAVLASRASILTEPSEVREMLKGVQGFEDATGRIANLHQRIGPLLDQPGFAQAQAVQVLAALQAAGDEALLSQLGSDVRHAELASREELLHSLRRRLTWVWVGFGLCWAVLALWLLNAVLSARRYALAAAERQQAVTAMQEAIASKRRFVGMVSHELRSPLQSIVTATESLSRDVALGESRPQSAAAIRRTRHAVACLQAQLRDLLTIARSDSSELGLQPETFECSELVRDVCADFEDAALAKGLSLQVMLPGEPQTVHADPVRIAQVLRNLLQNAVRYTSAGGVDVRLLAAATAGVPAPAQWMRFTVSDTGPGLPANDIARLKSGNAPFELGADAPTQNMRIGLNVVRDVLRQLGGRIEFGSEPGKGTVVSVDIPVGVPAVTPPGTLTDAEGARGAAVATGALDATGALRILIVDDQHEVLQALRDAVQHLGHHCDVAASALQAAPLLASAHYDTVLIDLEMPGESGLALARGIRSGAADGAGSTGITGRSNSNGNGNSSSSSNTRSMLILISAPENRAVGLSHPFDGFLQKPISSTDLAQLIGSRTMH